jgi:transcriptional regulator with XRE-family HTH domain
MIRMLRTAMRLLGFTNREIERRLGYTPSYLTRLFSGQIELRFEHIVDIVQAMGMTVEEFFRFSYPEREEKPTEASKRLESLLEEMRPTPRSPGAPAVWGELEFETAAVKALRKVMEEENDQRESQLKQMLDKLELLETVIRDVSRFLPPEEPPRSASKRHRTPARRGPKKKAPA